MEAICDHPGIRGVSFVGSTAVAKAVYQRATSAGKRVQALGGAKNFVVVMPDADLDRAIDRSSPSPSIGCAGERCLAGSVLLPVGSVHAEARERLAAAAQALRVGDGAEPGVDDGAGHQRAAPGAGARLHREGDRGGSEARARRPRGIRSPDRPKGFFLGPTLFDGVTPAMTIGREEIFGPVASITPVQDARGRGRCHARAPQRQRHLHLHLER